MTVTVNLVEKKQLQYFVIRVFRGDIIGDKSSTCICVFPIFIQSQIAADALFQRDNSQCLFCNRTIVRNDKPRSSIGAFLDENDESGKGQTEREGWPSDCRESMQPTPRECKCKIAADPFFFALIDAALSPSDFSLLYVPRHQSPCSSHPPPPAFHCYARTDKLISSGKSSSWHFPESVLSEKSVRRQSGTGNLIPHVFFHFSSHEHVAAFRYSHSISCSRQARQHQRSLGSNYDLN